MIKYTERKVLYTMLQKNHHYIFIGNQTLCNANKKMFLKHGIKVIQSFFLRTSRNNLLDTFFGTKICLKTLAYAAKLS